VAFTFVELEAGHQLPFADLVSSPGPIPDELSTDAVITVFEVLKETYDKRVALVPSVKPTSMWRVGPSGYSYLSEMMYHRESKS